MSVGALNQLFTKRISVWREIVAVFKIISLLIQLLLCSASFYYVNQLRDKCTSESWERFLNISRGVRG